MLSSRLSKLLLAALVAAFAIPAAASASMITYIDGKNVWVASPDGAIKRQLTTDGTTQVPYHVPSTDDHGNVAAVKGGLSNSKVLVHLGADGKRTDNVMPWKISLGTNFGPSSARLSADGTKIAYTYLLNHGPYNGGIEPRMAIVTPKAPGHPTQPMIDQPGWEMPTWIDGKLVVAKDGVALLEMQPLQFTQFLQINDFKIVSTEISRSKGRYLIDMSRTADNARGLVLYSHTGAFPGGTLPAGCQVPTHGTPSFTHGLSPDGTQVTWKDDRGVMVGTFDPAQSDGSGWCQGTVRQISATGDEPTFGNATLSVPQDPPPPPPPVDDTPPPPPSGPAPVVKATTATQQVRTTTGAPAAETTGDEELALTVPATAKPASLRGGLRIEATAPGAGTMSIKLVHAGRTLGTASKAVAQAGRVSLKLKLTKSGRKHVKRLKGKKVQLRMTFTPKGRGAKLTTSAKVTLR